MSSLPDDFSRSQLKDRKWKGEGVMINPEIARTPTHKHRRCTDLLCCIVFLAFIGGMIAETIYGYVNGNPDKLIAPIDGNANICGYTDGYKDYPDLYIGDLSAATANPLNFFQYGICIKSCPTSPTDPIECIPTTYVPDCTPTAGEEYSTTDIFHYCVPEYDSLPASIQDNWGDVKATIASNLVGGFFVEVYKARWTILIGVGLALVYTLIYIKFMDWCAFWLAWLSVILIFASFLVSGLYAIFYRKDKIDSNPGYEDTS